MTHDAERFELASERAARLRSELPGVPWDDLEWREEQLAAALREAEASPLGLVPRF